MEVLVYINNEGHLQFVLEEEHADSSWTFKGRARWSIYEENGNELTWRP
jgi:hypothetical protein